MHNWSGIGRYCTNLIKQFSSMDLRDDLSLITSLDDDNKLNDFPKIKCASKVYGIKEQIEIPTLSLKNKIDLYHFPHFVFPVINYGKTILTIHDLTPLLFPEYFSKTARFYMKSLISIAKYRANKIIAVSNNTKHDLIEKFKFPEHKIKVIYNGVEECYRVNKNKEDLNYIKMKYKTGDRFILYVGNIKPHKNIPRLLKALARLSIDIKLVIVGRKDKAYDKVFKVIKEEKLQNRVIFTGFVPDDDLINIYNAATVFIYPSLYEGFGLPPLEAMACGTPVITSNVSSLPEVVGNAAITVDPYDIEKIAFSMTEILTNSSLQDKLIKKGKERVNLFSWKKTAIETKKLYEELLK